jgi:hypothetical protein
MMMMMMMSIPEAAQCLCDVSDRLVAAIDRHAGQVASPHWAEMAGFVFSFVFSLLSLVVALRNQQTPAPLGAKPDKTVSLKLPPLSLWPFLG